MLPLVSQPGLQGPPGAMLLATKESFGSLGRELMKEYSLLYRTNSCLLRLLLLGRAGLREGRRRKSYAAGTNGQSVAVASRLALQGLLPAFSFPMAAGRFEARRDIPLLAKARWHVLAPPCS